MVSSDQVSRYHADITLDNNGQLTITDHSSNGTMVNGQLLSNATCFISRGTPVFFPGYRQLDWNQVNSLLQQGGYNQGGVAVVNSDPVRYEDSGSSYVDKGMGFGETLTYFFEHYTDFSGRARRKEYWYMFLWSLIFSPLCVAWALVTFIPNLALTVRRLHDLGISGWMVLIGFVPILGSIALFIMTCMDGSPDENKWGPSPKYVKR